MPVENYVNVREAAAIIGCTDGRVRQMLIEGRLSGVKANERAWMIDRRAAEEIRDSECVTGRPRSGQKNSA